MKELRPLAHVRFDASNQPVEHWLDDHLRDVAELAAEYAELFGADWARTAGIWHDLGKYNPEFQRYISDKTGYAASNAHIETDNVPGKVNHSAAGALYAVSKDKNPKKLFGKILAYLIAGHHAGLPDWVKDDADGRSLEEILQDGIHLSKALQAKIPDDILQAGMPASAPVGGIDNAALWIRMLFSSLVDADFLDTERFMQEDKFAQRGQYPELNELLIRFNQHMAAFAAKAAATPVNRLRAQILQDCREAAAKPAGMFSLTVPTGGGKTLSGMAFALEHAIRHGKQRIIYAIPYTSIIEQTANIYRNIFGNCVIEHHSNLDPDKEDYQSRLAAENWDAPIIVTTNVQLFESLFASRTSRCRKLHNLANSVIVLDEAQLLPPEFLNPILGVMKALVEHYGVTFVLSTATQPALHIYHDAFGGTVVKGFEAGQISEIMPDPAALFAALERVKVELPTDWVAERSWEDLAVEIAELDSVLVIVNTKKQAAELCRLLPPDTYYLSTNLCGEHRSEKLQEIRQHLQNGEAVRVVSTQLIEAGVDVDFPVVYRALAGLDSIAQAAGRCNREGKQAGKGRVVVFVPPLNAKLPGHLGRSVTVCRSLLQTFTQAPLHHSHFKTYFEHFYARAESRDKHGIVDLLARNARELKIQFRTAAQRFRLIDDAGFAVLVTYGEGTKLIAQLKAIGPKRDLMRKLQRYTVTVRERDKNRLVQAGDIRELPNLPGVYEQTTPGIYDLKLGLLVDGVSLSAESLYI
ncbi:CRISPR-associated helicase/endonuclease Cas3 [Thiothrix nivea]|uniref:CRISPR-associated helicase, Cas3 family n=1 Tax=Thiothrix nivea (strain ATCC 35100 / DSM 5205 / JP2) TaxID=870187 RepID=A0A656HF07_THINJ|nr:CRISPR-associated helicase/endonuclease Cas3 [Thiothrix nivea]EIJ33769.1 CRISPR-associated helicase, Cas3 family [Thiothrix nivea DSM 5205]